jgi:hypothetical protein
MRLSSGEYGDKRICNLDRPIWKYCLGSFSGVDGILYNNVRCSGRAAQRVMLEWHHRHMLTTDGFEVEITPIPFARSVFFIS